MEEWIIPVLAAFAGGTALTKLVDVLSERWRGVSERRRTEVDRIARQLRDAQRRERIAVEWGHKCSVLAIRLGATDANLPVLDFRDDPKGVN